MAGFGLLQMLMGILGGGGAGVGAAAEGSYDAGGSYGLGFDEYGIDRKPRWMAEASKRSYLSNMKQVDAMDPSEWAALNDYMNFSGDQSAPGQQGERALTSSRLGRNLPGSRSVNPGALYFGERSYLGSPYNQGANAPNNSGNFNSILQQLLIK